MSVGIINEGRESYLLSQLISMSLETLWASEESGMEGGRNKDYKRKTWERSGQKNFVYIIILP